MKFWSVATHTPNAGSSGTSAVALAGGMQAYHKTLDGIDEQQAALFGHDRTSVLVNECAAWMVAKSLGAPWCLMVPVAIVRSLWPAPPLHRGYGVLMEHKRGRAIVDEPLHVPGICDAAAFFDALIGQQDRRRGNCRWESRGQSLGLIDNGYGFAAPGDYGHASCLVEERHDAGRSALTAAERHQLDGLLNGTPLMHALAGVLRDDQHDALVRRAHRMQAEDRILDLFDF